ncbi:MAG TPA: aldo/keto reductase [Candidatus Acidoferrales bacterium]|nr:aldo/keto reductase [Candidatus Acidoferrales bacterium]
MAATKDRRIGGPDLEVSKLAFGMYRTNTKSEPLESMELVKAAYDKGINFFATSDNYGTEMLLGRAIQEHKIPRDKIVIATMTGLPITQRHQAEFEVNTSGKRIVAQVEKSRKLLGVDTIDLYQTHAHDGNTPMLDIITVMNRLIEEKAIRNYGFSNYTTNNIIEGIRICKENGFREPVSLQNWYNLMGWRSEDSVKTAMGSGMTLLAYSPLANGFLTHDSVQASRVLDKLATEKNAIESVRLENDIRKELRKLDDMAVNEGRNIQQLSLAWLMGRENTVPMLGAYTREHLDDLAQSMDWVLRTEQVDFIERVRNKIHKIYGELVNAVNGSG